MADARSLTRREIISNTAVVALLGTLSACQQRRPARMSEQTAPSAPFVELTLQAYGDTTVAQQYEQVAAAFNQQHQGRFRVTTTIFPFGEYIDKTISMVVAGNPPDVFNTWAQYKMEWVRKGMLLDLTDHIRASKKASTSLFLDPMVEAMTYQGKLWGTAQDFNGTLFYLNLDLFEQAGISLPSDSWTMEDYRELARRLTDKDKKLFGTTNVANTNGSNNFALMWNYGRHFWVSDDFSRALINSPDSVAMHRFFQEMQFKDQSVPWRDNPLPTGLGHRQGIVAIFNAWGNEPFWIRDTAARENRQPFRWKPMPFPRGPKDQKHFSQGHLWSIWSGHKKPDAAWVVAEWFGGIEGWREWVKFHRQPLPVKDEELWRTYYSFLPPQLAQQMTDFMVNKMYRGLAFNFQYWPTYGDCSRVVADALRKIYTDGAEVKAALDEAAEQINVILRQQPA